MKRTFHYFDWSEPLLNQAVAYLTRDWKEGLFDLSEHLIVVPSRHAGRRLRERLAQTAAEKHSAVLPGRVATPEILFHPQDNGTPVVDTVSATLLWQKILTTLTPADAPNLFPATTALSEFQSAHTLAREIIQLRALLCEEGYTLQTFAHAYEKNPEPERWQDLSSLERRYFDLLQENSLRDDCLAKIESAQAPVIHEDYQQIHILFMPDPPRLALAALEQIAQKKTINICIHAPDTQKENFDEWGRPLHTYWSEAELPIRQSQIQLSSTPFEQITKITQAIQTLPEENRSSVVIGVPDNTLIPLLTNRLTQNRTTPFDPAGMPVEKTALFSLLESLAKLCTEQSYEAFSALIRHPYMLDHLHNTLENFRSAEFMDKLDKFQNEHLPADLQALRLLAPSTNGISTIVNEVDFILNSLLKSSPVDTLQPLLGKFFTDLSLDTSKATDKAFVESARLLAETLEKIRNTAMLQDIRPIECMQLIISEFRQQRITQDRPGNAIDLLGWLELHWEDTPQLILSGMNDSKVPEAIVGHVFLPDQARHDMHLRDNACRCARDAYLFHAMLTSRRENGSVHACLSKTNPAGDPLRPSRLLFMCDRNELPERAKYLFRERTDNQHSYHRQLEWLLTPDSPPTQKEHRLPVTAFKTYLDCPFGYYLKRIKRMRPLDDSKLELDAMDFGNLCHAALHRFANSDHRDSDHAQTISEYLTNEVDLLFRERYGERLTLPLIIQLDTIRQRLVAAADIQAQSIRDGWQIDSVEQPYQITLSGWTIEGRIDRIDRNEKGLLRILDYKTSNRITEPDNAHVVRRENDLPQPTDKKYWADLQLPLYHMMVAAQHAMDPTLIQCGYFMLPKTPAQTGIYLWSRLDHDLLSSARACAEEVLRRIEQQIFWPPRNIEKDRDCSHLFFDTALESVDPSRLTGGCS